MTRRRLRRVHALGGAGRIEVVDLPGSYSLDGARRRPAGRPHARCSSGGPDVVVAVADATNLARSLYLPLQLLDLGYRVVVALNLSDEARAARAHAGRRGALAGPRRPRGAHRRAARRGPARSCEAAILRVAAGGGLGETGRHAAAAGGGAAASRRSPCTSPRASRRRADAPGGLGAARRRARRPRGRRRRHAELVGLDADGFLTDADEGLALEISKARHAEARALGGGCPGHRAPPPTAGGASPRRRAPASRSCSASSPPCSPRSSSSATCSRACSRPRGRPGSRRRSSAS